MSTDYIRLYVCFHPTNYVKSEKSSSPSSKCFHRLICQIVKRIKLTDVNSPNTILNRSVRIIQYGVEVYVLKTSPLTTMLKVYGTGTIFETEGFESKYTETVTLPWKSIHLEKYIRSFAKRSLGVNEVRRVINQ